MDLVPLLLKNFSLLALVLAFSWKAQAESFSSYSAAKLRIQELIGNAQKSIYLRTKFLTDGDLVMSIYVAKYRGVDSKVILGNQMASAYLSRYRDLLRQGVPIQLKNSNWAYPTSLLVDGKLYELNVPLDDRVKGKTFELIEGNDVVAEAVMKDFSLATSFKTAAPEKLPPPILQKPSPNASQFKRGTLGQTSLSGNSSNPDLPVSELSESSPDSPVGYRYKVERSKAPEGVDVKLPRNTKWQLNRDLKNSK
jgi:hypothetical protein